jgi:hypothetical protein
MKIFYFILFDEINHLLHKVTSPKQTVSYTKKLQTVLLNLGDRVTLAERFKQKTFINCSFRGILLLL